MKTLRLLFLLLLASWSGYAQNSDPQNSALFDQIANETAPGGNSKTRIANAYRALNDSKQSRTDYYTASGTDTYAVSVPWFNALHPAFIPIFFTNGNTGAATLNPNSYGAIPLKKSVTTALSSGDISNNQMIVVFYDGTNFQLPSGSGGGSSGVTSIATTSPITGGPITTTGTIAINNAAADGSTKGAASFTAADFNASSGNISIDYTNGQASSASNKGFLTSADWSTFNSKASKYPSVNRVTTNYTLQLSDDGNYVESNSAGSVNVTVPPQSSVAWVTNTTVGLTPYGAGTFAVVAGAGVTIHNTYGDNVVRPQFGVAVLHQITSDEWDLWNGSPTSVSVDGVTITGDGSPGNPLIASGVAGALINTNNLSDVSNIGTSRQNLGALASEFDVVIDATSSKTLSASDFPSGNSGKIRYLITTNASPHTFAIPNDATMTTPIGAQISGENDIGAGTMTFSATAPATVTGTSGGLLAPSPGFPWTLIKRAANTWALKNSGTPIGSANQVLKVDATGTSQEYGTVSNGLTPSAGSIKLGGALTADTNLSGAFSLGIGVAPSAKIHVVGLGTTTGELLRLASNTPTTRLTILDNGQTTHTASVANGVVPYQWNTTATTSGASQTLNGFEFLWTGAGADLGTATYNIFRIKNTSNAADYMTIDGANNIITENATIFNFNNSSSTAVVRNAAGILSIRGGITGSATRMMQYTASGGNTTDLNYTHDFTGTNHAITTGITRTFGTIIMTATTTSTNAAGNETTTAITNNETMTITGGGTGKYVGYDHNPTLSGVATHYAILLRSGNMGIADNTPAEKLSVAGNVKLFHIIGASTAPSVAAGTGAGTSPTVVVTNATDASGILDVTTGTTPAGTNAIIATVTFNVAYGAAPNVIFTANNANAAGLMAALTAVYVTSTTTTFVLTSGTTALAAATQYKWFYHVIQ